MGHRWRVPRRRRWLLARERLRRSRDGIRRRLCWNGSRALTGASGSALARSSAAARPRLVSATRTFWGRWRQWRSAARPFGLATASGRRPGHGFDPGNLTDAAWRVSENFLVAEPQANVLLTAHELDADRRRRGLSPDRRHVSARRSSRRRQRDHRSPVRRRPLVNGARSGRVGLRPTLSPPLVLARLPLHAPAPALPSRSNLD